MPNTIYILDWEQHFEIEPTILNDEVTWKALREKVVPFLKENVKGELEVTTFHYEMVQPIMTVLTREARKAFMSAWELSLYPITYYDEHKSKQLVLIHSLKTRKFMFIKKGEEGKSLLLKRFLTQWEVMTEYTMKFHPDGFFLELPYPLTEEEEKAIDELIDKETNLDDMETVVKNVSKHL